MLLAIDVGNTNTVLGLLELPGGGPPRVLERWRLSTRVRTTDELGLDISRLIELAGYGRDQLGGVIISCVVPGLLYAVEKASRRYLGLEALVVGSGLRTGLKLRTDNPREIGSDRVVNAVAALDRWGPPLVVVDFGTAITVDCVDGSGAYVGGAIAPGLAIGADALVTRTAKLPRVPVERPEAVIGSNTVAAMQAGLYYGYVGLVDALVRRCKRELAGRDPRRPAATCVATGGFSNLIGRSCEAVDEVDEHLTLRGLALLWQRNRC